MTEGADLKVSRASEHINEVKGILKREKPFIYVLETNAKAGERATYARRNDESTNRIAVVSGDAIHNLRSAVDHVYWDIVEPYLATERERRTVQFPFDDDGTRLTEAVTRRYAERVSQEFMQAILNLQPHGGENGNLYLYLIHRLNILDKHKLLVPTGDFTRIESDEIRKQVPDFPSGIVDCSFGNNRRDVGWNIQPMNREQRRRNKVPKSGITEKELNVPVQIVFDVPGRNERRPVLDALNNMAQAGKDAIAEMRAFQ